MRILRASWLEMENFRQTDSGKSQEKYGGHAGKNYHLTDSTRHGDEGRSAYFYTYGKHFGVNLYLKNTKNKCDFIANLNPLP